MITVVAAPDAEPFDELFSYIDRLSVVEAMALARLISVRNEILRLYGYAATFSEVLAYRALADHQRTHPCGTWEIPTVQCPVAMGMFEALPYELSWGTVVA